MHNDHSHSEREPTAAPHAISLRFVVFAILLGNLIWAEGATAWTNIVVVAAYLLASFASVYAERVAPQSALNRIGFTAVDALLAALMIYAHVLGGPVTESHSLTTTSLVVAFILLNHVGLKGDGGLVILFSSIVLVSWVTMLAVMAVRHQAAGADSFVSAFVNRDLGLAASFAVTAAVVYTVARDRDRAVRNAHWSDIRRGNLSRFFPPTVVRQLQEGSVTRGLERREAAVMFVDLREFTSFAETVDAGELAEVLSTYRDLVSETVLRHGGTVDKYIGDGVMAVFGQPMARKDDADRALACAIDLVDALEDWRLHGLSQGQTALRAGIGLHHGPVVGGVLEGGCHSEFTVIGDTVNVAQRLEAFTKLAGTPLAMSRAVAKSLTRAAPSATWEVKPCVSLPGRRLPIDVFVLRRDRDGDDVEVSERYTEPGGKDLVSGKALPRDIR